MLYTVLKLSKNMLIFAYLINLLGKSITSGIYLLKKHNAKYILIIIKVVCFFFRNIVEGDKFT